MKHRIRTLTRILTIIITALMVITYMPSAVNAGSILVGKQPDYQDSADDGEDALGSEDAEADAAEEHVSCLPGGTFDLVTLDDVAVDQPAASLPGEKKRAGAKSGRTTMPLLVIVVGFNDTPYNSDYDWGTTIFSADPADGSLSSYYTDNSQGKFTFVPAIETSEYSRDGNTNTYDKTNDGIIHVSVDMDHGDWSDVPEENTPECEIWASALSEAISQADEYVDFGQYDDNGNGEIENNELALGLIIAGGEASDSSNLSETDHRYLTWAHAWDMESVMGTPPGCDGTIVSKYIAIGEDITYIRHTGEDQAGPERTKQAGIGTLAHELGHYLGLPDYYDVDYNTAGAWGRYKVDRTSIMALGNWCYVYDNNNNRTYTPCTFDAYSRVMLGWVDPVVAAAGNTYTVNAQDYSAGAGSSGYNVLKVPTRNSNEYYLIENRQFNGWDEAMKTSYPNSSSYAKNGGLMFWHVDEGIIDRYMDDNEINTTDHRPGLMPTYMEYDNYFEYKFTGSLVDTRKAFFDEKIYTDNYAETAGSPIILPVYSQTNDVPSARENNVYGLLLTSTGDSINVTVTDEGSGTIDDCDHDWGSTEYSWSEDNLTCTATRTCKKCDEVQTETVDAVAGAAQETTCTEDGWTEYTATFTVTPEFGQQVTRTVHAKLGHDWGVWENADQTMHKRTCRREGCGAVETADHTWDEGEVTKEPSVDEEGEKTFTCTICKGTKTEPIDKLTPDPDQTGKDGTPAGEGASEACVDKAITSSTSEEGPAGTKFAPLRLKSSKQTKTSIKLSWTKVKGAERYVIYGSKCGKGNRMKKLSVAAGTSKTVKKIAGKKLKKGKYYKFIVVALDADNNVVSTSKVAHVATKGGKVRNPSKVTVKSPVVRKAKSLEKGKKLSLKARQTGEGVKKHRVLKYESTDPGIATVSKKGVIKAKSKGTCYIYAYAQSGKYKKIKTIVK